MMNSFTCVSHHACIIITYLFFLFIISYSRFLFSSLCSDCQTVDIFVCSSREAMNECQVLVAQLWNAGLSAGTMPLHGSAVGD
jgi:hypothetical protein